MAPTPKLAAKLLAEFVGTFTLVFTVCHDDMSGSPLAALSVASALMVSVYSLGSVSGGHFNPAVSFGLALVQKAGHGDFSFVMAGMYVVVQMAAGCLASLAASNIWRSTLGGASSQEAATTAVIEAGGLRHPATALGTPGDFSNLKVFTCETIFTAILVFVILNVATCNDQGKKEKNFYFALAIGFVIVSGASAIGHVSGCSLNPAVSAGVGVSYAIFGKDLTGARMFFNICLYSAAELLGAAFAVAFFLGCRRYLLRAKTGSDVTEVDEAPPTADTYSKLLSEFLGTYVLTLTVALVVVQAEKSPIVGVIGIACSLMVMVFSLGAVSGANFNPAVSFGLLLTGHLPPVEFAKYVLAQILGGLAAVATAAYIEHQRWRVALVANVPDDDSRKVIDVVLAKGSWGAIFGAEVFYTFLLVFVVLNVAVREAPNQYYGLAIGFVIIVGGVAIGGLSGGCFNPAVVLAMDFGGVFSPPGARYGWGFVYVAAELIGASIASGLFLGVSLTDDDGVPVRNKDEGFEMDQKAFLDSQ